MTQTTVAEQSVGVQMMELALRLFPLCRSLTGDGVRETLSMLREVAPIVVREVPSGTQAFDWVVPNEWNLREAYIVDPSGRRIIDTKANNLHVVGYSIPFEGEMDLAQLQKHLHSLPDRPQAIPYVTSYYAPNWGFCLSHSQREKLPAGRYRVKIDADLKPGSLTLGELLIPGESKQEILLSTYICHPSMANNELSGPLVAAFLARALLNRKHRRYSYRLVFVPETIGALVYLSQHLVDLKQNVIGGYVLTCIGDKGPFSYLETRLGDQLIDRLTPHVLRHSAGDYRHYTWLQRGSDERQYGWPGIDLPVGSLMRTKYGEYSEYHTSDDNLSLLSAESCQGSLEMVLRCLEAFEMNRTLQCTTLGEPQLGRRGLYPTLSTCGSGLQARTMVDLMAYCDGQHDLLAIADKLGLPIWELDQLAQQLLTHGLLKHA